MGERLIHEVGKKPRVLFLVSKYVDIRQTYLRYASCIECYRSYTECREIYNAEILSSHTSLSDFSGS